MLRCIDSHMTPFETIMYEIIGEQIHTAYLVIESERLKILTPKVAQSQHHLQCITPFIPPVDRSVNAYRT